MIVSMFLPVFNILGRSRLDLVRRTSYSKLLLLIVDSMDEGSSHGALVGGHGVEVLADCGGEVLFGVLLLCPPLHSYGCGGVLAYAWVREDGAVEGIGVWRGVIQLVLEAVVLQV